MASVVLHRRTLFFSSGCKEKITVFVFLVIRVYYMFPPKFIV